MREADITYRIHWNSVFGRVLRFFRGKHSVAITLGRHIYMSRPRDYYNMYTRKLLIEHEVCHVKQYARLGFFRFIVKYLWLWMRYGLDEHPMEKECSK